MSVAIWYDVCSIWGFLDVQCVSLIYQLSSLNLQISKSPKLHQSLKLWASTQSHHLQIPGVNGVEHIILLQCLVASWRSVSLGPGFVWTFGRHLKMAVFFFNRSTINHDQPLSLINLGMPYFHTTHLSTFRTLCDSVCLWCWFGFWHMRCMSATAFIKCMQHSHNQLLIRQGIAGSTSNHFSHFNPFHGMADIRTLATTKHH